MATQTFLMRCRFAEQRTEIHSHTERNRIQLKMHAAAVGQLENKRANRTYIQRGGETVVAHQVGTAGGFGGILKHAAVSYNPAGSARIPGYDLTEKLLLAPRRHVVSQGAYPHRVAKLVLRSRLEVRDFAEGQERAVKEVRVIKRVAHTEIGERSPAAEFPIEFVAPIERHAPRAESLFCVAGRNSARQGGDVIHRGIPKRQTKVRVDVTEAVRTDLGAGGGGAPRE